jgi:hypothetical protein
MQGHGVGADPRATADFAKSQGGTAIPTPPSSQAQARIPSGPDTVRGLGSAQAGTNQPAGTLGARPAGLASGARTRWARTLTPRRSWRWRRRRPTPHSRGRHAGVGDARRLNVGALLERGTDHRLEACLTPCSFRRSSAKCATVPDCPLGIGPPRSASPLADGYPPPCAQKRGPRVGCRDDHSEPALHRHWGRSRNTTPRGAAAGRARRKSCAATEAERRGPSDCAKNLTYARGRMVYRHLAPVLAYGYL